MTRLLTAADAGTILKYGRGFPDLARLLKGRCPSCRRRAEDMFPAICLKLETDRDALESVKNIMSLKDGDKLRFRSPRGGMVEL